MPEGAQAQEPFGPSEPSVANDCGIYQWPLVQSPCPEVQIKQKHDHTPLKQYASQGWDTVVTCAQRSLTLTCMPFLPVQYFNGQYKVDTIPFDPPDPTFALGMKMPVSTDDDFASDSTIIPFPFFFFGKQKDAFVLGANGLVSFNTASMGKYCPWNFTAPIPWASESTNGAPKGVGTTVAHMRDAIYGIYEDTHPIASYLHGDQGIYYGVQDDYPCRKIICSWNGIPTFPGSRNQNNRCTYQIVCYEGSNIIEVHIKRRGINSQWQGGNGLIGIQNATGQPQTKGGFGESTVFVTPNSPAAFYPSLANHGINGNLVTTELDSVAFRFTPQGNTVYSDKWFRIFDDGRDSIQLTQDVYDTNGYYTPMGSVMATCPTLTRAVVTPTRTSRYVYELRFMDAAQNWYFLRDTITIGMDTGNVLTLRPAGAPATQHQVDICSGSDARMMLEYPELQDTLGTNYHITRITGGANSVLPDSLLQFGQLYADEQSRQKCIPLVLRPDAVASHLAPGAIDSVRIDLTADFVSGCHTTVSFLVRIFPNYDTTERHGICQGETFTWAVNGQSYTASTTSPQVNLPTIAGCDSVVHLDLTVSSTSASIDEVHVCKPYTWINGQTYTETNTATTATDTVHLQNIWGCDSLVQLMLTVTPMTPLIDATREYFDFDHLDIVLTDVSTGGNGRTWYLPSGDPQSGAVVYYTAPYNLDSAVFTLVETSPYGCVDTATLVVPFQRDVIWAPNAFVPDDPANGNDRFRTFSNHLVKQQTLIYNRRGELVFRCNEIDCPWDGTDLGGNECPQGSYVYIVRYITEYEPDVTRVLKGTVTLIR